MVHQPDGGCAAASNDACCTALKRLAHDARFFFLVERHEYAKVVSLLAQGLHGVHNVRLVGRFAVQYKYGVIRHRYDSPAEIWIDGQLAGDLEDWL